MGEITKKLNLGCGEYWKTYPDYAGLDVGDYGQRFVGNVLDLLKVDGNDVAPFYTCVWDEVMANHFLEHFNQEELKLLLKGIYRILRHGGIFKFVVPHKDREEAWDLTHKTFWNENTVRTLESIEGFGRWKVKSCVTNDKKNIHAELIKI